MQRADLEHIARQALEHDLWILSDEIYSRIHYLDHPVPTIAALPHMAERTVIVDGFSKTYAMTGWRLGFGIMPADLAARVELLLTHAVGCSAHFTQIAAVEALLGSQESVDAVIASYRRRRDFLVGALNDIPGVHCLVPEGAFYAFPNVSKLGPSEVLADYILDRAGVAHGELRLGRVTTPDGAPGNGRRFAAGPPGEDPRPARAGRLRRGGQAHGGRARQQVRPVLGDAGAVRADASGR